MSIYLVIGKVFVILILMLVVLSMLVFAHTILTIIEKLLPEWMKVTLSFIGLFLGVSIAFTLLWNAV